MWNDVITNISQDFLHRYKIDIGCKMKIKINKVAKKLEFCKTYSDVTSGQLLVTIGGHGYLELAINKGNAAEYFNLKNENNLLLQIVGLSV